MTDRHTAKKPNNNDRKRTSFLLNPDVWVWLLPIVMIIPNVWLAFSEHNSLVMRLANIFLPAGLYLLITGAFKRTGRVMLSMFPVCFLCAFQVVLLYLYGESIIAIDMYMNVLTTNVSEATELLGNLKIALVSVFVLYLPPLILSFVLMRRHARSGARCRRSAVLTGAGSATLGLILLIIAWSTDAYCRPERELFPYNVTANIFTASQRTSEALGYDSSSKPFSYHAVSTRPDSLREVYVFVIGETGRADHWSLFGYNRPTNPKLSVRSGLLTFTRTLSEINTTHKSVPMLMSSLDSHTFGDSVASTRSVFEAFNSSGFDTWFISNQRRNHSYIDYYGEEANNVTFLTDDGKVHPDMTFVEPLRKALNTPGSRKTFVVLHSYGSHFVYNKRYPEQMAKFKPDGNTEASQLNRSQLINAYDNTILYTDALLDSLIDVIDRKDAVSALVYVSDHGEDIFDDSRERFLHASPVPTYYQLHVPMLVWMSPAMQQRFPELSRAARANRDRDVSSTQAVFHTLIQLGGLSTPYFKPDQSLVSDKFIPATHRYLNDYNESVSLDRSGLRPEDFHQLRKHKFTY